MSAINSRPMTRLDRRISVAPMMTHTDRHFRYFLRLLSPHVMLYTEMVTTGALIHGDAGKLLKYNPEEHPVALQLGGNNPADLARCAQMAAAAGYDEVNLNIGCPSDRVQSGAFGACLMAQPERVAECVAAMQAAVAIPVTVKCRIGIDHQDSYAELAHFVGRLADSGCRTFIIHARKAWLQGLSPRQNREVPPLQYATVHQIKRDFPALEVIINGGFTHVDQIRQQFGLVDGVMIGRAVCNNPYLLTDIETSIFKHDPGLTRSEALRIYTAYAARELRTGTPLSHLTRNILGMFHGQPGARGYRRYLSENMYRKGMGVEIIDHAMQAVAMET